MTSSNTHAESSARRPHVREIEGAPGETSPLLAAEASANSASDVPQPSQKGTWNGLDDFQGLPWWRTPSVWFIIVPMPIFTLAFGGILVPKFNLILSLVCKQYFADHHLDDPSSGFTPIITGGENPQCRIPGVQRNASNFLLIMNLLTGLLSAVVAPKMGQLSDRFGRRRLMALASCGGIANEIITIIVAKNSEVLDYRWLIVGSLCDGLTGSFTAGSILAHSYIADCTPPSERSVAVGRIQACLFGGLAFGPLLSGYFIAYTGSLISFFYVAVCCHAFFIIFVRFVTPDSLSKKSRRLAQEKWEQEKGKRDELKAASSLVQFANLFAPLKALWPHGPGTSSNLRRNLVLLAAADTIIMTSSMGAGAVILLYSAYMFNWSNLTSSQFISTLSLVRVFALMILLPLINYFGRTRPAARLRRETGIVPAHRNSGADLLDLWILRLALISDIVGIFGYIFVRKGTLFFLSGMLTAVGGLGSATTQALLTKHVPQDRVGQVLGAVGMAHALARVVGPIIFNGIYALTVGFFPQAAFVTLAVLFTVAIVSSFIVRPHVHWQEDEGEEHAPDAQDQPQVILGPGEIPPQYDEDPLIVH